MSRFIFGYGSLLWRPGFPFVNAKKARLLGLSRRLEQGSPDHRGTPEQLGRVATLVQQEDAWVGGLVYELPQDEAQAILVALDEREQGGYDRVSVRVTLEESGEEFEAITWIAWPGNPFHLGPKPLEAMVSEVLCAVGPSGTNVEYVLRLEETLLGLGFVDEHIQQLAFALREALSSRPSNTQR